MSVDKPVARGLVEAARTTTLVRHLRNLQTPTTATYQQQQQQQQQALQTSDAALITCIPKLTQAEIITVQRNLESLGEHRARVMAYARARVLVARNATRTRVQQGV